MSYKPLSAEDENGPVEELELTVVSETIHKRALVDEQISNGSSSDDKVELIRPEERNSGEYNDYEEVLKVVGFGVAHVLLLLGTGVALSSDAVEVLSISFALPILSKPWELSITHWQNGLLSSVIFIGMLIGGYTWGGVADITGRRSTLITSLSVNGVFGALSAFSPNFYVLLVFRFLSGVGVGGSLPVIMGYTSEFIQTRYRGPFLGTLASFWMIGALLCGAFAWAVLPLEFGSSSSGSFALHSWRIYLLVSSLPSLIGAVIFIVMPESPRFLLEIGKEKKAIKILKRIYDFNYRYTYRKKKYPPFPIKRICLSTISEEDLDKETKIGMRKRLITFCLNFEEVFRRSLRLFYKDLLRSTILLLIIYFCLSFGSYGVTLWYPTYVDRLSRENLQNSETHKDCNKTFVNFNSSDSVNSFDGLFCECPRTNFSNVTLNNLSLPTWWAYGASYNNMTISGGHYSGVWFKGMDLVRVALEEVELTDVNFINVTLDDVSFCNVTFVNASLCGVTSTGRIDFSSTTFVNSTLDGMLLDELSSKNLSVLFGPNSSYHIESLCTWGSPPNCLKPPEEVDYRKEYFYDFLIAGSAFPGNVVSATAVYFFRRSYWLAFSLLCSTVTVFLLFFVHTEVYAVLILCLFKAITIPGWNVTSLLVAEIYPTSLRTTASGVLLLKARIGAIIGTYVFGAFSNTEQISVPILLTAAVLFVSSVASLFLPKTNRKTALK